MLQITIISHCFQYKLNEASFHASQMPHPKPLNTTNNLNKGKGQHKVCVDKKACNIDRKASISSFKVC